MFSYDEEDRGACGETASSMMGLATKTNGSFSEQSWQDAKQRGNLVCPGKKAYPQWPPPSMTPALNDDCRKDADLGSVTGDDDGHPNGDPLLNKNRVFEAPFDDAKRECRGKRIHPEPTGDPQADAEARFAAADQPLTPFTNDEVRAIMDGRSVLDERAANAVVVREEPSEEDQVADVQKCSKLKEHWNNMIVAFKGCGYDLAHWKCLPEDKNCLQKFCYAVGRDGRLPYILTAVALGVIFIVALVLILFGIFKKKDDSNLILQ